MFSVYLNSDYVTNFKGRAFSNYILLDIRFKIAENFGAGVIVLRKLVIS